MTAAFHTGGLQRLFHSLIQPFDYGVGATLQKFAEVINDLAIVLLVDCPNTWAVQS